MRPGSMTELIAFRATLEERRALEAVRRALGAKTTSDALRHLILREAAATRRGASNG